MPPQCNGREHDLGRVEGRRIAMDFNGGQISSDAGALPLAQVDRSLQLTDRVAACLVATCFKDDRDPDLTEHSVRTLVMQRIVAIALDYEDLSM